MTVLAGDGENGFTLSPEVEAELPLCIAEADRGETISAQEVFEKLIRRRGGPKNSPRRAAPSMRTIYNSWSEVLMKYRVALHKSEEGYSVSVPGLPGCWSQGATENEALENIRDAVREYLTVVEEQLRGVDFYRRNAR